MFGISSKEGVEVIWNLCCSPVRKTCQEGFGPEQINNGLEKGRWSEIACAVNGRRGESGKETVS